tara:strand:- start:370 stop:1797 length:1428 start_codon:yes stop_codon:yes gene_type:complete
MAVKSSINTQFAPGQNPYDTYLSLDGAAQSIDADIERGRKNQERDEQKRLREMQLADIKSKNMAGLMVSSETQYEPLQSYMQDMSRNLVDKYSGLVSQLEKGEIDSTYFAAESAKLQGQVPQVKSMVDAISGTAGQYSEGLAQGTLSGAIPKDQEMYFQAILNNKGNFGIDDNNILVFQGETADGEPFSIPANKLNQMPQPIGKVDDFQALVLPTVQALMKPEERSINGRVVMSSIPGPTPDNPAGSQEWQNGVAASFDSFLKTQGENGLKSLAVDHAGYSIDEMNDALNSGSYEGPDGEQYSSRLEYEMEKRFTEQASENYELKQFESFQQMTADRQQRQLTISEANAQTARINSQTNTNRGGTEGERYQRSTGKGLSESQAPSRDNIESWGATSLNKTGRSVRTNPKDGKVYIMDKGKPIGIIPESFLNGNPNELARYISAKVFGVSNDYTNFNYKTSKGPLNKLAKFFKREK